MGQEEGAVKRRILAEATRLGVLLNPEALSILIENYDEKSLQMVLSKLAEEAKKGSGIVVSKETVENVIGKSREANISIGVHTQPLAKDIEEKIEILKSYDAKQVSDDLEARKQYFADRCSKISSMLRSRADMSPYYPLRKACSLPDRSEGKTIVMVYEKRENYIVVEDMDFMTKILIPKDCDKYLREKIGRLLPDSVVGVSFYVSNSRLFCKSIIFPDVPIRSFNTAEEDVSVILTSDIHYGSQKFSEKAFLKMVKWLREGGVTEREQEMSSRIKYIIIAGDLVDGIGIYPQQEKELNVRDLKKQYTGLSNLLSQIPEHIKIIVIPGNHDAALRAIPQPPIFDEYAEILEDNGNIISLSNPCMVSLHGVKFLVYHGTSMEDIATFAKNASYDRPENAMEIMLQLRHLAPVYGSRTPIITNGEDKLVIEEVPDVFHTGHVHVFRSGVYREIKLINSGTWQERTKYQEQLGIMPTPNIAAILSLKNGSVSQVRFE
ncbi:MAG: DNA-directed DNA polymerase II small subunit [Crenarchaeota archaeon]|nr:DNA-directed DNA polymerase II small subunit [Thermoproteota archaeon]MDW8033374.1 DNA-directed DNA polymerase II small subunit [Nitrososphaerota archaeon]